MVRISESSQFDISKVNKQSIVLKSKKNKNNKRKYTKMK